MYGPKGMWSKNHSPLTAYKVSVENQFLPESTKMNGFQDHYFWTAYEMARKFHGSGPAMADKLANSTAENWNLLHVKLIKEGTMVAGLGGMMRMTHARKIIRTKALVIQAAQAGGSNPYDQKPAASTRKRLRKEGISTLSYADAVPFLRKIGRSVQNTAPKRRQQLMEHFNAQNDDDYELVL